MQGKQAHPTGNMQGILLGMITLLGYLIGNIVDDDHPIKQENGDKNDDA